MEIRELEAFVAVVDQHNFTRAAEELSLTQPAITRQVASLERELGARLLDRMGRTVELTEAGRALYSYASDMLRLSQESRRAVGEIAHGASGRLSIGSSSTAATYLLPRILQRYAEQYPHVQLSLRTGPSALVAELVTANTVDLAIVMDKVDSSRLAAVSLGDYSLAAVFPPDHPLAKDSAGELHPERLKDSPLIVMQPGATLRRHVEQILREAGASLHVQLETDNVETIKKMVEARLGISIVPELAVSAEAADGRLIVRRLYGVPSATQPITAVHRTDKYVTAVMRQFLELLTPHLPSLHSGILPTSREESC